MCSSQVTIQMKHVKVSRVHPNNCGLEKLPRYNKHMHVPLKILIWLLPTTRQSQCQPGAEGASPRTSVSISPGRRVREMIFGTVAWGAFSVRSHGMVT